MKSTVIDGSSFNPLNAELNPMYMFRLVLPPTIRSAYNCIYSIWYLSHRYCYLPLSWKIWKRFELQDPNEQVIFLINLS